MNKYLKDTSNDELINAYIGINTDKFRNNNFSIYMFLFGFMYLSYRKMWLASFIWLLLINFLIVIPQWNWHSVSFISKNNYINAI